MVVDRLAGARGGRLLHEGSELPKTGGLYAFVHDNRVVYVGIAVDIRRRVEGGHCRPRIPGRKPRQVTAQLHRALRRGERVHVMIATPRPKSWNGIEVNTALGLEPALIKLAQPAWNVMGNQGEEAIEIWREAGLKAHASLQKRRRAAARKARKARKAA